MYGCTCAEGGLSIKFYPKNHKKLVLRSFKLWLQYSSYFIVQCPCIQICFSGLISWAKLQNNYDIFYSRYRSRAVLN